MAEYNLNRFVEAQATDFTTALNELKNGRKRSHWMWYIFPQVAGLGMTETSRYYAINNIHEAAAYLMHPQLGPGLIELCEVLTGLDTNNPNEVFGSPDDLKLKSSMTLFDAVPATNSVFSRVLDKFYNGQRDQRTLQILNKH